MNKQDTTHPKNAKTYTQLSERQLGWLHIVMQWLCIEILNIYCHSRYSLKILGRENLPPKWVSMIVASNHSSSMDPPFISVSLRFRPISYMAKIELFRHPLMRLYNWSMSAFAVNREKLELSTIKTALKVLKHGQWALGLFPEGTRKQGGEAQQTKRGVAYFSKTAQAPVLPIGIYRSGKRVCVSIGELIPPEADMDRLGETIRLRMVDLIEQSRAQVEADG